MDLWETPLGNGMMTGLAPWVFDEIKKAFNFSNPLIQNTVNPKDSYANAGKHAKLTDISFVHGPSAWCFGNHNRLIVVFVFTLALGAQACTSWTLRCTRSWASRKKSCR